LPRILSKSSLIGTTRLHLRECASTTGTAEEMLKSGGIKEGFTVTTDHQKDGLGQVGNRWISGKHKDITSSTVLKPAFLDIHDQFYLNIISSLAVRDLLSAYLSEGLKIKWPNDIVMHGKKVCGILIKNFVTGNRIETTIVGIGINVNNKVVPFDTATSLTNETNREYALEKLTDYLFRVLDNRYSQLRQGLKDELLKEYLSHLFLINEVHTFRSDHEFEGIIRGIDETGRLRVEENGFESSYSIKEIVYLK
jgi:BirA family biotin operon repressor/biotin-[acetyl-CoA-carboxylase] ligase